jgi:hypothetical protein
MWLVTGAQERRRARGEVRKAVLLIEGLRWGKPEEEAQYRESRRNFMAAAMTAGLPRELVERYSDATNAAWAQASVRREAGSPVGSIDLNEYVDRVRKLLVSFLWSPWRTRLTLGKKLKELHRLRQQITAENTRNPRSRLSGFPATAQHLAP